MGFGLIAGKRESIMVPSGSPLNLPDWLLSRLENADIRPPNAAVFTRSLFVRKQLTLKPFAGFERREANLAVSAAPYLRGRRRGSVGLNSLSG